LKSAGHHGQLRTANEIPVSPSPQEAIDGSSASRPVHIRVEFVRVLVVVFRRE
jgi:hypothetical protein